MVSFHVRFSARDARHLGGFQWNPPYRSAADVGQRVRFSANPEHALTDPHFRSTRHCILPSLNLSISDCAHIMRHRIKYGNWTFATLLPLVFGIIPGDLEDSDYWKAAPLTRFPYPRGPLVSIVSSHAVRSTLRAQTLPAPRVPLRRAPPAPQERRRRDLPDAKLVWGRPVN